MATPRHSPSTAACSGRPSGVTAAWRSTRRVTRSSSRSARQVGRSRRPRTVIALWRRDPSGSGSGSTRAPPFERPKGTWVPTSTGPPGSRPPEAADRSSCRYRRCSRSKPSGSRWWISAIIASRTCKPRSACTNSARETSHRSGRSIARTSPCRPRRSSVAITRWTQSPHCSDKKTSRSSPSPVPGAPGRRASRSRPPPKPPSSSPTASGGCRSRRSLTATSSCPGSRSPWRSLRSRRRHSWRRWCDGSAGSTTSSSSTTPSICSRASRPTSRSSSRRRPVRPSSSRAGSGCRSRRNGSSRWPPWMRTTRWSSSWPELRRAASRSRQAPTSRPCANVSTGFRSRSSSPPHD